MTETRMSSTVRRSARTTRSAGSTLAQHTCSRFEPMRLAQAPQELIGPLEQVTTFALVGQPGSAVGEVRHPLAQAGQRGQAHRLGLDLAGHRIELPRDFLAVDA